MHVLIKKYIMDQILMVSTLYNVTVVCKKNIKLF